MGGISISMGEMAFKFNVFPNVPVILVLWLGDEEFEATANILFNYSVTEKIHMEDIASVGPWLVRRMIQTAKEFK